MFDIFRKEIKVSDKVKLYLTSGREVEVEIIEIGDNYILVINSDGTQSRFFETLIGGWDLILEKKPKETLEEDVIEEKSESNEIKQVSTGSIPEIYTEPEKRKGLTIVGKIDLAKIEPKRKKLAEIKTGVESTVFQESRPQSLTQHIREHNLVFNSFKNLNQLKEIITSNVGEQTIPANAVIKRYGQNLYGSKFGFVTDNEKRDYYFSISDVYDEKLVAILNKPNPQETHIVCSLKSIRGKLRASTIYLPKTIEEFQAIAETFYKKKDFSATLEILNFILNTIHDFEPAVALKSQITKEQIKNKSTSISPYSIYLQAKTELKRGNIDYAKQLLIELIQNPNIKSEAALKELSYELQREGKIEDAIQLVKKYHKLIISSNPNSLLAYFYETKKDYFSAITFLEKVKPQSSLEELRVQKRLAISFFQIKDYDSSEKYLKKVIAKLPNDFGSIKLLDALEKIKSEGLSDEIETIFNEAELTSFTGGRSPYIRFSLANSDYAGVPPSIAKEERFTKKTLKELRNLIDDAGRARPKERATYLLTEAKLMEQLEPEDETGQNSILSRYCFSNSQNLSSENQSGDVIRFYLLEAYRLSSSFEKSSRYLLLYFNSFYYSSLEASKMMSKADGFAPKAVLLEIDTALSQIFSNEIKEAFWYGLTDLFLTNTEIFSQLLTRLFQNLAYQRPCVAFLSNYLGLKQINITNKESFSNLWNEAVDKRRREKEAFSSKFNSLGKSQTTEAFSEAFISANNSIPSWISNLDKHRVNSIDDILKTLLEFNTQAAFEDKERYFNIAGSQINALQTEIEASPTEFSFNILRPQLEMLNKLVDKEFKTVIQTSKPIINIKVLGESIIHDNNLVIASISVSNKKGSAPISWFLLELNNSDGIEFIPENNESNQSLKGGDDKTLKLKVQATNIIREQGAFNLKVKFSYKIRGNDEVMTFNENLAIRLYSENEFDELTNPFAATADSGPVQDERMFYGRNEFIDNIKNSILESSSKCVIIYGQKRSGKSSVLFHLKKQLNQSAKAFCISFSLGEIVEDLSAQTFYYKVLSEIEDSLDSMKSDGKLIPKFSAPTLSELKEAPSLIFNDYMKKFRKECSSTDGWENKNLVLLIDEFTYIYTAIQKGFLSDQFMKTWKSFVEKSFFTSILIGQDIMPKFKMAYQNEFGIAEDKRLSYLSKEDAIKLIDEPIWDVKRNRSRYLGKAMELILDYTSSNPYYIQIFCARLVEHMNNQKAISVTEADVYEVAQTFINGEQALSPDKFDNLITAGDADIEAFNPKDILKALKEIAFASKNLDSCSRDSIKLDDKDKEEQILTDLRTREVISCPQPGFYKIKVRLFKEWLINN